MALTLEKDCPCTKEGCVRHGNCVACFDNHNDPAKKPSFCRRQGFVAPEELQTRVNARLQAAGKM
jgi:hypothetical protein